jgi:hypothetical protein
MMCQYPVAGIDIVLTHDCHAFKRRLDRNENSCYDNIEHGHYRPSRAKTGYCKTPANTRSATTADVKLHLVPLSLRTGWIPSAIGRFSPELSMGFLSSSDTHEEHRGHSRIRFDQNWCVPLPDPFNLSWLNV